MDLIMLYEIDNGMSINARPDHGWFPLNPEYPDDPQPGPGMYRVTTSLLGTYDNNDKNVIRQHFYWMAAMGIDAVQCDITNTRSPRLPGYDGMAKYFKGTMTSFTSVLDVSAEKPEIPLSGFADKTYFKVYMSDIGLLRVRSGISAETILNGSGQYIKYKGALAENLVYEELVSLGKHPYFWRSGNTAELDFLYDGRESVVPVEVKSKLSEKNLAENMCEMTRTISLPMYMVWNIPHYETRK